MATKLVNFRVTEEEALRIERRAKSMPYRTVSQWLREVITRALDDPEPAPRKSKVKA